MAAISRVYRIQCAFAFEIPYDVLLFVGLIDNASPMARAMSWTAFKTGAVGRKTGFCGDPVRFTVLKVLY